MASRVFEGGSEGIQVDDGQAMVDQLHIVSEQVGAQFSIGKCQGTLATEEEQVFGSQVRGDWLHKWWKV